MDGVQVPFRAVSETPLIGKITIQFSQAETNIELPADAFAPVRSKPPATAPK